MANVKNFGLTGVGSDIQLGKGGARLASSEGVFNFKAANGSTAAALTAAGITSSAGNVTLTTGNVVLSDVAGKFTIGGTDVLARNAAGLPQISGSASVVIPAGATVARGEGVVGAIRVNNDTPAAATVEYYNGTTWSTLATGGNAAALQTEVDNIELALGAGISATGEFQSNGFTSTAAGATSFTDAINKVAAAAAAKDTLDEILPGTAGQVIYNNAGVWTAAATGAVSGVQAYDADLDALAGLSATGFAVRTADNTWAQRSITGSVDRVVVTNGDGVLSSPTIDLASVTQGATGSFVKVTLDGYGRVTGNTNVVTSDITALVDSTYVNLSGDTMTGNLVMSGATVTGLPAPVNATDAANKSYVDNAVSGLTWKNAVQVLAVANVTLSGLQTVDGILLAEGDRVLLTGQTVTEENGIYIASAAGWIRAADAATPGQLSGAAVFVQRGTYADSGFTQTVEPLATFAAQDWAQFSGAGAYSGGTGITVDGTVISANLGAGIVNLPAGEIGVDVVSSLALQLTSTATDGKLTFVLEAAGGLSQSAAGLKIAAAGVTNDMLLNSGLTLDADSGTGSVALGGTLNIIGTSTQGISTSTAGSDITITVADATTTTKGVASFNTASFDLTAGAVTLKTVDVAHGGTGATSFVANQLLIGNGTGAIAQSASLSFTGDTLTVGSTTIQGAAGGDTTITSTATNGDIVLMPNGTGTVQIGAAGAGLIQSDAGTALTVRGNTVLTLESVTGSTVMALAAGTTSKVTVSGPTAVQYATGLADADLTNKSYVDTAIAAATATGNSGDVKAIKATVSLVDGTTNIGALLPAGATVLSVKTSVTLVATTGTLVVGKAGSTSAYMADGENDLQSAGLYLSETYVTEAAAVQVIATVAGATGTGSAQVIVTYQLA